MEQQFIIGAILWTHGALWFLYFSLKGGWLRMLALLGSVAIGFGIGMVATALGIF